MPRPDFLIGDEPARLIPVTPDSARELKSVSVILAGLRSVLELRQSLLKSLGVRVGTNATLEAWIEPVFQNEDKKAVKNKDRPDGLLILRTGRREWRALIEAKVGNDTIGEEQVSRYLQQAKNHKLDAVITITNQFAALPTHHPVKLPKNATKSAALFHWSCAFIRTQSQLLLQNTCV